MRQWSAQRKNFTTNIPEGTAMISYIYQGEDKLVREDKPLPANEEPTFPAGILGWWRWTVEQRPPTQRELNERLERLFLSLKDSTAATKPALQWLTGLYLTRKRILRQEPGGFIHIKSGEKFEVRADALAPEQVQEAMGELMNVIR